MHLQFDYLLMTVIWRAAQPVNHISLSGPRYYGLEATGATSGQFNAPFDCSMALD